MLVLTAVPRAQGQAGVAVPRSVSEGVEAPHAAQQAALDAALQQHVSSTDADRAAVLRVMEHPEVAAVAGKMGIDLRRAATAVATLDGAQLTELAAQARQVDQALAGGQSRVVISTTVIIIALLVLILIIVAVD
jgi:hypothetical protein